MILDATCSEKRRWPAVADVRVDINPETKPDVVADAQHLPFADAVFTEVYCDPPHFIRFDGDKAWLAQFDRNQEKAQATYRRFSHWKNHAQAVTFLERSMVEFERVLIPGGELRYKVPDGSRSHGRVLDYREVIHYATWAGLRLMDFEVDISDGLFSRANVRRGRAPSLIFRLRFCRVRP